MGRAADPLAVVNRARAPVPLFDAASVKVNRFTPAPVAALKVNVVGFAAMASDRFVLGAVSDDHAVPPPPPPPVLVSVKTVPENEQLIPVEQLNCSRPAGRVAST